MRSPRILAALGAVLAASLATTASPAHAAVSSASINANTATLNLDGADDNVTVSVSNGVFVHGQTTGGLNSGADWDSATPGDQTVPADGSFGIVVNGGAGNDAITALAKSPETNGDKLGGDDSISASDGVGARTLLSVDGGAGSDTVNGSDGPDLISGGEGNDVLSGGAGDDRIVGDRGNDTMNGGTGDDTLVWNNGDATDVINGDTGRDDVEVNGAPTAA